MTRQDARSISAATPQAGAPTGRASQRMAWLLFAPPAFMVAVRWLLQLADDRQSATPALALAPVSTASGTLDLLWPAALVLALLVAAGLALRRIGWRRAAPVLAGLWVLLWLAGSGAMLQRHLNRQGLFMQGMSTSAAAPAQAVTARVVASRFRPPSLRGPGGTELVLQVAGLQVPQRLLIDDASAALVKPGATLALQLAPGRFGGRFVTGWQALPTSASH
jgi:hypothetical protein